MAKTGSRQRFIETTARLVRERGFAATGMADVVTESGAPKGSLYFHFPDGKDELVAAALAHSGGELCEAMKLALDTAKTVPQGLDAVVGFLASELSRSGYRAGCPVGTVAAEAPDAPRVRVEVDRVFGNWQEVIKTRLVEAGAKPRRARELADFVLSVIEGAIVLVKARRTLEPLENAKRELTRMLRNEGLQ
jgi:TetR/AcrR family transcriptional repressor of lmrAB and yxaGH operons